MGLTFSERTRADTRDVVLGGSRPAFQTPPTGGHEGSSRLKEVVSDMSSPAETPDRIAALAQALHERLQCDTRCLDPECVGCKREIDMLIQFGRQVEAETRAQCAKERVRP
jgi:hypothetical protein